MSEFVLRVKDVSVDDVIEIPDSARDVEIEYYEIEDGGGIGGSSRVEQRARVKYLEKQGQSVP